MTIEKQIEIDGYKFTVSMQSRDERAHSLMTDYKDNLEMHVKGFASGLSRHPLPTLIAMHREDKR